MIVTAGCQCQLKQKLTPSQSARNPTGSLRWLALNCCRVAHCADATTLCRAVDWEEVESLQEVAADVDVLYQTRIQKERFQDRPEDYEKARGKYIIDNNIMKILRKDSVIMHPLPRVDEVRLLGMPPAMTGTVCSVRSVVFCSSTQFPEACGSTVSASCHL